MPDDATDLSYWVTQNLPLDDSLRLHLLSINNAIQRLRCALSMIIKVTDLSYWVKQNLSLDDSLRLHLLSINNVIQRLRCALSMIIKVTGPTGVLLEPILLT